MRSRANLEGWLDAYFERLRRDARKARADLKIERETEDGQISYLYRGATFGRGRLFHSGNRAFVLEAASSRSESLQSHLRRTVDTFAVDADADRWALLGLDVSLPSGLMVERKELLTGRTRLQLRAKGAQVEADRWGFADQLLRRHSLVDWSQNLLNAPKAEVSEETCGLRLTYRRSPLLPPFHALVQHQPDRNQLTVLVSRTRTAKWRPEWDWLT